MTLKAPTTLDQAVQRWRAWADLTRYIPNAHNRAQRGAARVWVARLLKEDA